MPTIQTDASCKAVGRVPSRRIEPPDAPPPPPPPDAPVSETALRILDGLIAQVRDFGLRRFTVEDVARRAGVTRITVYAHFANKDALLRAGLAREAEWFFADLTGASEEHADPEERLVETLVHAQRLLREHPILERTLRTEPEVLLPMLAGESPILAAARAWVEAQLAAALPEGDPRRAHLHAIAELTVRVVHSLLVVPGSSYDVATDDGVRALARDWLLPVLRAAT